MLTERMVRSAKPAEKRYLKSDSRGLSLEVYPTGGKYWVLRYYIDGKEHRKQLGVYPEYSLNEYFAQNGTRVR